MAAVFFVHGAVFASWAARVPAVKDELGLSAGVLGLVMAGPGIGALAGSQAGGLLVHRLGGRGVGVLAPLGLSVPLGLIPVAGDAGTLLVLLVLLGAADGCTSVAMNAQAVVVQRWSGRTVMNGLHAVRSLGAVAGGLAGAATAGLGLGLTAQFVLMAAVLAVVSAVAACGLPPDAGEERRRGAAGADASGHGPGAARPAPDAAGLGAGPAAPASDPVAPPPDSAVPGADQAVPGADPVPPGANSRVLVLLLALTAFLAALVEDTPASWSGVYLREAGADPAVAAAGYAAFSAGGVVTRLLDDRLVDRLGWVRLIRAGTLCCAAALTVALISGDPFVMLGALVVAGAGVSAVFPGAFTAAGALPQPALAMGQIGFAGNLGWLLVPPVVGGLATLVGLRTALGVLVLASVAVALLAGVVRGGDAAGSSAGPSAGPPAGPSGGSGPASGGS